MTSVQERLAQEAQEVRKTFDRPRQSFRDITKDFISASEQLEAGQLVKDEWFTLFEAVGALEIMDPKMDSGCIPAADAFEPDFDIALPLPFEQILWIMNELLCLEILWLDGYPLSQTIFTSLHTHRLLDPQQSRLPTLYDQSSNERRADLDQLKLDLLTAYCIGMIKSCELIIERIQSQTYYEEEDFVTHTFGRDLLPKVSATESMGMLQDALNRLERSNATGDEVTRALKDRLELRKAFLTALEINEQQLWEDVLVRVQYLPSTHGLAAPQPDAFSDKVQRQLATSTPPRPMLVTDWTMSCTKWYQLCSDILSAFRFTALNIIYSPACLHRAVWAFSNSSKDRNEPTPLARAVMQDLLFANGAVQDQVPHYDLLLLDIRELVLAGEPLLDASTFEVEVPTDPRHICARLLEGFIEKVGDEYLNLYRMVCQNQCRVRRTFTQALPIWDALEIEADQVDMKLAQSVPRSRTKVPTAISFNSLRPLWTWARFHKLRLMTWTIQLGMVTDIYLPDELAKMYWYLTHFSRHQTALLGNVLADLQKRTNRADTREAMEDCRQASEYLHTLVAWSDAMNSLGSALSKIYTVLEHVGLIVAPKRELAEERLMHEARMKPFLAMANERIPTVDEFRAESVSTTPVAATLEEVELLIKGTRQRLAGLKKVLPEQGRFVGTEEEWKADIKGMEAGCVTVAVACTRLKAATAAQVDVTAEQSLECKVEKKFSRWWPVPVISQKQAKPA